MCRICPDCEKDNNLSKLEVKKDILSQAYYYYCWICNKFFADHHHKN